MGYGWVTAPLCKGRVRVGQGFKVFLDCMRGLLLDLMLGGQFATCRSSFFLATSTAAQNTQITFGLSPPKHGPCDRGDRVESPDFFANLLASNSNPPPLNVVKDFATKNAGWIS